MLCPVAICQIIAKLLSIRAVWSVLYEHRDVSLRDGNGLFLELGVLLSSFKIKAPYVH